MRIYGSRAVVLRYTFRPVPQGDGGTRLLSRAILGLKKSRMPEAARRYSALLLLALMVFGWVLAPIAHEIEHAAEWASTSHHHGPEGGFSDGHEILGAPDDCTLCLTRASATGPIVGKLDDLIPVAESAPPQMVSVGARASDATSIRGPPVVA